MRAFRPLLLSMSALALLTLPAQAEPRAPAPTPSSVAADARDEALGKGWSTSADRAWTTVGDADGLHVLVADARDGYAWRTAATLSEQGFEVDQWIGNACVTGSGRRLVVVYAPRTFTNDEKLFARGGFTAVVDLETGGVTKLPVQSTLAYFNPGCGVDESAVVTQAGDQDLAKTRVLRVDAVKAKLAAPIDVPGQLTSAVPVKDAIVAADSHSLVRVANDGTRTLLAPATGVPFQVSPDAEGGVVFLDKTGADVAVRRSARGELSTLATGPLTEVDLARGAAGKVFVTGAAKGVSGLPASVVRLDVPAKAEVSTHGDAALTAVRQSRHGGAEPVGLELKVRATGKVLPFSVAPRNRSAQQIHPTLAEATATTSSLTDPVDADRFCSVPRNDLRNQTMQPKPRQVEWAVDQAVRGVLTVERPGNWKNLGMPAYTPQGLFPRPGLDGGGYIPAQIMLGIAAQESNLWQASRAALPGVTANPLIGNFYGRSVYDNDPGNDWSINWAEADCGYGVTQLTDGMRLAGHEKDGETALPYQTQRAVALDFAANVAAGVQLLENKWNQVRRAGLVLHDGNPQYLENWFYAVWAYNSGFYPDRGTGAPWGLGWANNPVNPHYPPNRTPFLEHSYDDARHPQDWPYPEKVIGWAGHPIESVEAPGTLVGGYRWAWWPTEGERYDAKPPVDLFCDSSNDCYPGTSVVPNYPGDPGTGKGDVRGEPAGPCAHKAPTGEYDLKCWYHRSTQWQGVTCEFSCGNETLRFDPGYPYQVDGTSYPPNCTMAGLPSGAIVVDDVPGDAPMVRTGCTNSWVNQGEFQLSFGSPSAKIDFHQIGGGWRGHFWFGHTRKNDPAMRITGTWRLNRPLTQWARVLVHLPDHGAWSQQAKYTVTLGNGSWVTRHVNQAREANNWVSLGVYPINGTPTVTLSTETADGRGDDDVAWDAVAFQPLAEKPRHIVAALGDSYTSGEGAGAYLRETDIGHGTKEWNACRRSQNSWPRKMRLPGHDESLGAKQDRFDPSVELSVVACSGAQNWNVNGSGVPYAWDYPERITSGLGQHHEMSQVTSGAITPWTTLVVMTVGGNDEGAFTEIVEQCMLLTDCLATDAWMNTQRAKIDRIGANTEATIKRINGIASQARIVLMGYPELFARGFSCATLSISTGESVAVSDLALYMAETQKKVVDRLRTTARIPVEFADAIPHFSGHGACGRDPWINGLVLGPHGDGDNHAGDPVPVFCFRTNIGGGCNSRETLHPHNVGTTAYAHVMQQKLIDIDYRG